ncbi:phosphoribosylaminoimidazolesuccinocarboxamide synthase [Leptolyngbya sp. BC1307]|uniref:phosphoribosylaminoimidazolesuccinocarboxamide synthase n=1 Tax=Leptolyngbya sp. BC1307 TaxID=2029589 RepID=UPI001140F98A|nr:phosphoribosylaminoimidazolesuccinocarboxamide synthase [Leptolyngbya sp. BC1307]
MGKRSPQWLWGIGLMSWVVVTPAWANCAGQPGSVAWYEPVMSEHLQRLQSQPTHSWGSAQILDRMEGDRILLTEAFETLSGPQKNQALKDLIEIDFEAEVTEEQLATVDGPSPYQVIGHDGRLLSAPYDGCTRDTLLTEQSRFSWYYNNQGRYLPQNLPASELRNAGQPSWRQVNFPIETAAEKSVRLRFWQSVGYQNTDWWIAWVPERGYFEVNVPVNFDYGRLQRYWPVADRNYRYVVVRADGTRLGEKRF